MKTHRPSYEERISKDYEKGRFKSVAPSKAELKSFKEAARATFIKDRRVNVRLSSPDLMDIQTRAAEEGVPYQTLIASVLHKFVTGRFTEKPSRLTTRSSGRAKRRGTASRERSVKE
jgi:predicted DNA binding CopG/RHH family protein